MRRYSHTALKRFQRCQYMWSKYYIDRIQPKERAAHFKRGSDLHDLLESYHTLDMGFAAKLFDAEPDDADILVRYAEKWEDEEWSVLHAEEEFELCVEGKTVVFIPDLVIEINGEIWIVDHKTTANIPDEWDPYNMTDFQHLLYIAGMQQIYGDKVKGFIFNYLRTKPPTQPTLVKDGTRISNLRAIDTTADILQDFAEKTGTMDEDVKEKLLILKHAPDRYFQRHYLPINQAAVDQAVKDTAAVLREMSDKEHGRPGGTYPRNVLANYAGSASCARCDYQPICHTELLGLEVDIDLLGFEVREESK